MIHTPANNFRQNAPYATQAFSSYSDKIANEDFVRCDTSEFRRKINDPSLDELDPSFINTAKDRSKSPADHVNEFLIALEKAPFSHGDIYVRNIMWDSGNECFVLIDSDESGPLEDEYDWGRKSKDMAAAIKAFTTSAALDAVIEISKTPGRVQLKSRGSEV
ncbi:MAG TPA: hypothetical protein VEC06_17620 [Paucimonas sp.]|nr:hypothetical protein [Paucimonas sp.]